jgi:hypothetical protein
MSATPFADLNALAAHLRQELQNVASPNNSFCSTPTTAQAKPAFPPPSKTSAKRRGTRHALLQRLHRRPCFWDNDLEGDRERYLQLNSDSRFFAGLNELEMDNRIRPF